MKATSSTAGSALDLAAVAAGGVFVGTALLFRLPLWRRVAAFLPDAPHDFAVAFAGLTSQEQTFLFPLGVLTAIAVIVLLFQQGTASLRGRLRLGAILALLGSSILSATAVKPVTDAILAGTTEMDPDALLALIARWSMWQWVNFGLVASVGVALVVAHRLPAPAMAVDADGVTPQHRTLLLLLGAATLFEGYDRAIVTIALPYIGRDLGADEGQLGYALSIIRIGGLLSVVLGGFADRIGRRKVLLFAVLAYTLATGATGLSRGLATFVAFQLVATIFLAAELSLAQVVIAEEFPAAARARGQGLLGAFAALGAGVVAMLFPAFQHGALGWRGLYFVGVLPLLLLAYLQRSIPETRRFERLHGDPSPVVPSIFGVWQPGLRLRFAVLVTIAAAASMIGASAFNFASYHATKTFGWAPGQVSVMILTGGGIGFSGWFIFGRLAEVLGRRLVGAFALLGGGLAVTAFFRTTQLMPAFAIMVFMEGGVAIAVNSLGTELFPTALRATAKSWITNASILGAMVGLSVVGAASDWLGGITVVIPLLCLVAIAAAPLFFLLPESRGHELEELEETSQF